jgi:hypothetical protein
MAAMGISDPVCSFVVGGLCSGHQLLTLPLASHKHTDAGRNDPRTHQ